MPLTVDVAEKSYAAGKLPGGFFKREGRPATEAILASRMIDRPIRPLFSKTIHNEIQIIVTILASDQVNPYPAMGIIGASTALAISDIAFNDPIGACVVGLIDGELVVNRRDGPGGRVGEVGEGGEVIGDGVGAEDAPPSRCGARGGR